MRNALRTWVLVLFPLGLLPLGLLLLYESPAGRLYSPELAALAESELAQYPASDVVTPTGWLIVVATIALCTVLVVRGVHHLRTR